MDPRFVDFPLRIVTPKFESELTDVIIDLDHLRQLRLIGNTPPAIFMQLKGIFHMLESLGSARIEGNHTTLADYVETKISSVSTRSDQIQELANLEKAMDYLESEMSANKPISEWFIRELHSIAVSGLVREGDATPGQYRITPVRINGSSHLPPDALQVPRYMSELVDFVNQEDSPKYDLLKMAIAHHRFCWIHPFGNGNGRTVRLLSYAMLIKYGFNVQAGGRVLNPTAVFCNDRNAYNDRLSDADIGGDANLERWCMYVLGGIKDELHKVDRITDYSYLKDKILMPALAYSRSRELITDQEGLILSAAIKKDNGAIKASDIETLMPELTPRQRTYLIHKLVGQRMIQPIKEGARSYTINFSNNYLLRSVVFALEKEGFIPSLVKHA